MLTLLAKDFKLLFYKEGSKSKKILTLIAEAIMLAALIAIETILFSTILKKIKNYSNASDAFLVIFLACVSIIMIILGVSRCNKLFFNDKDTEQLVVHPIANDQIIISKLIFLFLMHYATSLLFVYPLFISYGLLVGKTLWFYYIILFYPFFSFFFEMGVALLFVYPFKLLMDYLKKHIVLEFILSIALMVGLSFIYSKILDFFMQLVTNNNLNLIFSSKNIDRILSLRAYLVPINFLTDIFIYGYSGSLWALLSIEGGVFIIGLAISIVAFSYFRSLKFQEKKKKKKEVKVRSIEKALLRKEFLLLFKDQNYIFTFTGLLIIQPFLMLLVIQSINKIFSTGSFVYFATLLPAFVPLLDILIILLFTVIISSGASQYITMEKNTIKILKTIPVSYKKQLGIKVLIPLVFSFISLVISLLVLVFTSTIAFSTMIFAFLLSFSLLLVFDMVSLIEELNIKHNKPRQTFYSKIISYLLPTLYFVSTILLTYTGTSIYIAYGIGLLIFGGFGAYLYWFLKKKMALKFMELEMVN